jgi:hypothetical protein
MSYCKPIAVRERRSVHVTLKNRTDVAKSRSLSYGHAEIVFASRSERVRLHCLNEMNSKHENSHTVCAELKLPCDDQRAPGTVQYLNASLRQKNKIRVEQGGLQYK